MAGSPSDMGAPNSLRCPVYILTTTSPLSDKVYIAPSGVQKERIEPTHIFVLPYPQTLSTTGDRIFLRKPTVNLKESACTPLFWNAFDLRDAGSCIHTHSQNAVMATLMWSGDVFTISHQVRVLLRMWELVRLLVARLSMCFLFGLRCDRR